MLVYGRLTSGPGTALDTIEQVNPKDLAKEASSLLRISRRLRRRLLYGLKQLSKDPTALPSRFWLETYKAYTRAVTGLLAEQRERVKIVLGAGSDDGDETPITDEQASRELEAIAVRFLLSKLGKAEAKQVIDVVAKAGVEVGGVQ